MGKILPELRVTAAATIIAVALIATGTNIVEPVLNFLLTLPKHGTSALWSGAAWIAFGLLADFVLRIGRKRRQANLEEQKLQAHRATMRTVLHIVNNFLNGLLLFELEAEPVVSRESFEQLERLVQQTHERLKALGDLDSLNEIETPTGTGIALPDGLSLPAAPAIKPAMTSLR